MLFALCILLAWAAVAVQIGENLGNLITSTMLMMVVSPLIILGSLHVLQLRLRSVEDSASKVVLDTKDLSEFELSLRHIARTVATPEELGAIMDHFKTMLDETKQLDEEVTLTSCKLWYEITLVSPSRKSIDKYLEHVYKNAKQVRKRYVTIVRKFPDARGAFELYLSFITQGSKSHVQTEFPGQLGTRGN
jgi:hypothetical protein